MFPAVNTTCVNFLDVSIINSVSLHLGQHFRVSKTRFHTVIVSPDFLNRMKEDGAMHPYFAVKKHETWRGIVTWAVAGLESRRLRKQNFCSLLQKPLTVM